VTEQKAADGIAALELARAQIEIALSTNADWVAFRQAAVGSRRLLAERALAVNPLYRSWSLLNDAIQDLYAKGAPQVEADTGAPRDDLTRIRGIGSALALRLAERGVTTFAQIAAWRPDDVRDAAEALGLRRKISRQNWIEQAALLDLRRRVGTTETVRPGSGADGLPADNAHQSGRPAAQSIELSDVLRSIRDDAALRNGERPSVVLDVGPEAAAPAGIESPAAALHGREQMPEPVDGALDFDGVHSVPFQPEETTVTFVIREPVRSAPALSREIDLLHGPSNAARSVAASDTLRAPAEDQGTEAEVEIVSGTKDHAARVACPKG
jgi:hypothetical protein